jgi:hypothetical protein
MENGIVKRGLRDFHQYGPAARSFQGSARTSSVFVGLCRIPDNGCQGISRFDGVPETGRRKADCPIAL